MTNPSVADHAAVATLPNRIVQAWAEQDPDSFAEVFTDDGTMILPGVFLRGRDEIRAFMGEAFAGPYKDTKVTGDPIGLRFLGGDVAILHTDGGFLMGADTKVSDSNAVRAAWLVVKQDGTWRLAAYQNSPKFAA
ncbi:SgcJ/EcaC family oxidoreductase [Actinoplanes sp. NPDC004185]